MTESIMSSLKWPSMFSSSPSQSTEKDAPLHSLPPQEAEAMAKLRVLTKPQIEAAYSALPTSDAWRTLNDEASSDLRDEILIRFLRYNNLNIDRAARQMEEALKWRSTFKVAALPLETMYGMGVGLPLVCLCPCNENGDTLFFSKSSLYLKKDTVADEQFSGVATMFEQMLYANGGPRAKRATIVVDCDDFSYKNVDLWCLKRGIVLFTSYFPDVFCKIILVNYPKFVYGVWKAVAPLVDARTTSRIVWVADKTTVYNEVVKIFDASDIPTWMGGKKPSTEPITLYNRKVVHPDELRRLFH